ncbi:MAG: zinc-ribbon domain-containing protein [Methanobacterium sp.]|nr:zinc-ribbon domain-containing protein [Methanobacterium sp.]
MFCPSCGTENLENAQFCQNCGKILNNTENQPFNYYDAKKPSILIVILGYILSILGGFFGILIGLYLLSKDNPNSKFHGRNIFIIAIISMILGLILTML